MRLIPIVNAFTPLVQEPKVFTQSEVEAIEKLHLAKLEKERAAKEHAQQRIQNLSNTVSAFQTENQKLKFFNEMLTNTLLFILNYKGKDKEQQNG